MLLSVGCALFAIDTAAATPINEAPTYAYDREGMKQKQESNGFGFGFCVQDLR